jgi:signal transduction histidine kinase
MIIGCGAMYLASLDYSLLALGFLVQSFHSPIASIPLIFAILGFRTTTKVVLAGMASGFVTVVVWRMFFMDITGIDSNIPGSVGNIVVLFGLHYLLKQPGGWVGIKDPAPLLQARLERRRKWECFYQSVRNFSLINFCKNNAPKNELTYTGFGIFSLVSSICTMYSTTAAEVPVDKNILLFFYETMLILSVSFITYPIWPQALKKDLPVKIVWNFSVFYILIICSTFFVMLSNFSQIQLMISLVNLIVVATLMRWQAALVLIFVGVFGAVELYEHFLGLTSTNPNILSMEIKIVYLLLLLSSMLIMFFKPKQEEFELTEAKNEHLGGRVQDNELEMQKLINLKNEFIRNINHEIHTPITSITSLGQTLWMDYDKLSDEQRREAAQIIAKSSERLNSLTNNILDLSKLSGLSFQLNKTSVNLSNFIYDRLEACIKMYLDGKNLEFITDIEPDIILNCDKHYIQLTLDNFIINAINYSASGTVKVSLHKKSGIVEFTISDEGIGIPKDELFDIFNVFTVSSKTRTPAGGRGVGLALCKKAIEAHGGTIWADSDGRKGAVFKFAISV